MQIIYCLKLSFNIAPGIIVEEEVEEEVEGSSKNERENFVSVTDSDSNCDSDSDSEEEFEESRKWTDRALMLQSGLLTALQVEEQEYGDWIQRIRAR